MVKNRDFFIYCNSTTLSKITLSARVNSALLKDIFHFKRFKSFKTVCHQSYFQQCRHFSCQILLSNCKYSKIDLFHNKFLKKKFRKLYHFILFLLYFIYIHTTSSIVILDYNWSKSNTFLSLITFIFLRFNQVIDRTERHVFESGL